MARRYRSKGYARQQRRKFVWDRTFDAPVIGQGGPFAVDLLQQFRNQPGATHLGATVMRVRGYIRPILTDSFPGAGGVFGMRVDSWNEEVTADELSPVAQPDEDWMAWLPWAGLDTAVNNTVASWNPQSSVWAVDVKAGRKLQELNQTLWLCTTAPSQGTMTMEYDLSVGLKLA